MKSSTATISDPENTPSDYSRNRNRYRHENSIHSVDSNLDRVISVGYSKSDAMRFDRCKFRLTFRVKHQYLLEVMPDAFEEFDLLERSSNGRHTRSSGLTSPDSIVRLP